MSTVEILTIIISLSALLASGFTAYRSYFLSEYQLRLNSRLEFHKLLLEVNKATLADPTLRSIYDEFTGDPADPRKLWTFAYMNLNIFETIFSFYWDSDRIRKKEKASYDVWVAFLRNTLENSSFARNFVQQPQIRKLYHPELIKQIDEIIGSLEKEASGIVMA